jgi:hypothetical protein
MISFTSLRFTPGGKTPRYYLLRAGLDAVGESNSGPPARILSYTSWAMNAFVTNWSLNVYKITIIKNIEAATAQQVNTDIIMKWSSLVILPQHFYMWKNPLDLKAPRTHWLTGWETQLYTVTKHIGLNNMFWISLLLFFLISLSFLQKTSMIIIGTNKSMWFYWQILG